MVKAARIMATQKAVSAASAWLPAALPAAATAGMLISG